MLKLLHFLWCGCWHKWTLYEKVKVKDRDTGGYFADDYVLQCERCGDFKKRRL